jgi:hypothetical protein
MMSGLSPFSTSPPLSPRGKRTSEEEIAIGKLLTHQIPVVVAFGEVAIGTIAADAGAEDVLQTNHYMCISLFPFL